MFTRECNYLELVRKAQRGDRDSLARLAETARVRLHEYVFRLTLKDDLTQDIVQETILDMLRLFGKLREADSFWAWLYGIAFNKVRSHYGRQWRHKTSRLRENGPEPAREREGDVLAAVITEELKQIVLRSLEMLEPRHRAVLTMRCYDHMSYAQIGRLMGCSEIGTRALFYRAKKALTRQLSRFGLGKGALLMALVVFGKLTAASEAAAAEVSVSAATLSVGPAAALLATATSKVAMVTFATAGVLAGGSMVITREPVASLLRLSPDGSKDRPIAALPAESSRAKAEYWYYFPEGPDKSVMTRLIGFDEDGKDPVCLILENQHANYCFHHRSNTVTIRNHHVWQEDLRVKRLPTDPPELSRFLSRMEGGPQQTPFVAQKGKGLLVVCEYPEGRKGEVRQVDRHPNVLQEEYFQFGWPQSAHVVDQRDPMHQRGWTYFRLHGQINGATVSGSGRLPFVYTARHLHYPWLALRLGPRWRAVDTKDGAVIYDPQGRVMAGHTRGSLFAGLARPWMGLHTIDTIRRDAAGQQLRFQTQYDGGDQAKVIVDAGSTTLTYTINMKEDSIARITFTSDSAGEPPVVRGELEFTYLQDIDGVSAEFAEPRVGAAGPRESKPCGILWLVQLFQP